MRFRTQRAGVVLFMIYSALLITLTLSLTSRSDGDLLGPVSSLRVCQERVHWAVFVHFFFSFSLSEREKSNGALKSYFFFFVFCSCLPQRVQLMTGVKLSNPSMFLMEEIKFDSGFFSPPPLRWTGAIVGLSCQSCLDFRPAVNKLQS